MKRDVQYIKIKGVASVKSSECEGFDDFDFYIFNIIGKFYLDIILSKHAQNNKKPIEIFTFQSAAKI